MTFIFRNITIFWDIPKWNRGQTKWDRGSIKILHFSHFYKHKTTLLYTPPSFPSKTRNHNIKQQSKANKEAPKAATSKRNKSKR